MDAGAIRIQIPEQANFIVKTLQDAGHEAYVVGGCVRDSILGRNPNDWDITTNARPEQVKALFRRTVDTGLQHGTVTVMIKSEGFEVTTYRIDGEYEDSRHPKEVIFTPSLEEDLKRRDFTINAMAYNDKDGLVDLFGGLEDIDRKRIACVGNPKDRFTEDALRMLRAVRFSAQLGYEIEENTAEAIKELAPTLERISKERIQVELVKMMVSDHPDYIRKAYELKMTAVFLPELDLAMETEQNHPHHCYSVGEHILHSLIEVPPVKALRLAMLFHDIGKPKTLTIDEEGITHFYNHAAVSEEMAKQILRRLKFDNATIAHVCRLVLYHDLGVSTELTPKSARRAMAKVGIDYWQDLMLVRLADIRAQSDYMRKEKLAKEEKWRAAFLEIEEKNQCVSLKSLAIGGRDLMELGVKPGPGMGDILEALLNQVIEKPELNTKETLTEIVKASFL